MCAIYGQKAFKESGLYPFPLPFRQMDALICKLQQAPKEPQEDIKKPDGLNTQAAQSFS